jgi:hypothetical protein
LRESGERPLQKTAAVTLPFFHEKGEPFEHFSTTVPISRDGKVAKKAGEPENLSKHAGVFPGLEIDAKK